MEPAVKEALRAKAFAEKQFIEKDFLGAKNYALKAQMLCPELEGISQMVVTFGVYVASEAKFNGELDFYSILGLDSSTDKSKLKKQYKKMAVLLHPDKNKTVGADGAFRLVSEAWTHLSDNVKRSSYDQRRNLFAGYGAGAAAYDNCSIFATSNSRLDTFWTVCSSCHVQYEYLRKYVNKRLSCKNCRGIFIAVETGLVPLNGSFPYSTHGGVAAYRPTTTGYCAPNGSAGHNTGYRPECVSNISFQAGSTVNCVGGFDPNGLSASSFVFYHANGNAKKLEAYGKHDRVKAPGGHMTSNGYTGNNDSSKPKRGRPAKVRQMELGSSPTDVRREICPNAAAEAKMTNGNVTIKPASSLSTISETSTRRVSAAPALDARQLLIDRAKTEIRRKLEEMRLDPEAAAADAEKRNNWDETNKSSDEAKAGGATGVGSQSDLKRSASISITVPDSDFHDFDQDRSEECFKPKQIWALYDEEDGMPRLYCLIREVISVNPFKIQISYLSSRSDCEFGSVNWLDSGFTKSCGSFRLFHSEVVEHVNIFSHLLSREKTGRGGCLRIYPRSGDIWAVYRNWSPDWNRSTPDEARHQYEMVEVLSDYSDENGVWVTPLIKVDGYKTVYQKNSNTSAIRWIPRREMLRFSHQVPSCSLKVEGGNLPEGCWDLDPAATPDVLLQGETELRNTPSHDSIDKAKAEGKQESEQDQSQSEMFGSASALAPAPAKRPKMVESAGKHNSHGTLFQAAAEPPETRLCQTNY